MHQGGLTFLVLLGHLITFRGWQERGWGHVLKGTPRSLGSKVAVYHTELLATWGWGAFCLDPTRSQKSVKNNSNCGSKAQVQKPAWAPHERACRGPGGGDRPDPQGPGEGRPQVPPTRWQGRGVLVLAGSGFQIVLEGRGSWRGRKPISF